MHVCHATGCREFRCAVTDFKILHTHLFVHMCMQALYQRRDGHGRPSRCQITSMRRPLWDSGIAAPPTTRS